jgi:endoglucanase
VVQLKLYHQDWDYRKDNTEKYPQLKQITSQPNSFWLVDNPIKRLKRLSSRVHRLCKRAHPYQPVIVLYSIPDRDVGGHSKGGLTQTQYHDFINEVVEGIGDYSPIVIIEPDALPHMRKGMSYYQRQKRTRLIKSTIQKLSKTNAVVYLDIGHPKWLKRTDAITYLGMFHSNKVQGFSINTSNFVTTDKCIRYGDKIAKHFGCSYVIDTSRNGNEVWETFNPQEMKIGNKPTTDTDSEYCDAYLWIKTPGESDGAINGWPKAGRFNAEKTLEILK